MCNVPFPLWAEKSAEEASLPSKGETKQLLPKEDLMANCLSELEAYFLINQPSPSIKDYEKSIFNDLRLTGQVMRMGSDEENRPAFVGLQEAMERYLAQGIKEQSIREVFVQIYTPMPASPLCTQLPIDPSLSNAKLLQDTRRMKTLSGRVESIRMLLAAGAQIESIYPDGGLQARSEAAQKVYRSLLAEFPNLKDRPISRKEIPASLIGAVYRFKDAKSGIVYGFAIQASQANAIAAQGTWGLWLGPVDAKGPLSCRLSEYTGL